MLWFVVPSTWKLLNMTVNWNGLIKCRVFTAFQLNKYANRLRFLYVMYTLAIYAQCKYCIRNFALLRLANRYALSLLYVSFIFKIDSLFSCFRKYKIIQGVSFILYCFNLLHYLSRYFFILSSNPKIAFFFNETTTNVIPFDFARFAVKTKHQYSH